MARVITYVMILVGVLATFAVLGIGNTATSQLLNAIGFNDLANTKSFDFWNLLFGTSAGVISLLSLGIAVTIGLFTRQSTSEIVLASFASTLGGWIIGDLVSILAVGTEIFGVETSAFGSVIKVFVAVLIAGGIVSMVQWWRGSDF